MESGGIHGISSLDFLLEWLVAVRLPRRPGSRERVLVWGQQLRPADAADAQPGSIPRFHEQEQSHKGSFFRRSGNMRLRPHCGRSLT